MLALILDTSGELAFIGIAEKGELSSQEQLLGGRHLSKMLFPKIESLLAGKKPDFIALGTGPGSFTGTRVGAITAKILAYGWSIPLILFSSALIPKFHIISRLSYQKYLYGEDKSQLQIELAYIPFIL